MKLRTIRKTEEEVDIEITGATLLPIEDAGVMPDHLWRWLRSPADGPGIASIVSYDGCVFHVGFIVDHLRDNAVRPALKIENLKSTNLKIGDSIFFGGKEFEIISDSLAFCKTDIGEPCPRKDCAKCANKYERSDIKKFIDDWFENVIRENNED